ACTVTVSPCHSISLPAERSEASGLSSATGNSRSLSSSRIVVPTSPVAPSTPTLYPSPAIRRVCRGSAGYRGTVIRAGGGLRLDRVVAELEDLVQHVDRVLDPVGGDDA